MSTINSQVSAEDIKELCDQILKYNYINPDDFNRFNVKRGLRNSDGTGVMAGISRVCSVEGYYVSDGERIPKDGRLTFRGISMEDIVRGCMAENRFGFEEIVWLLLFGSLPTQKQLSAFCKLLSRCRELPDNFAEDMIMKAPSPDIMNKLARSVLALYSSDENPDDTSLENVLRQCISIIAQIPVIMVYAYQVKRRHYDKQTMFFHPFEPQHKTAEAILNALREDRQFTHEEAQLLDLCMVLHAEHGGGNNSTFTTRVLSSAQTDIYSTIAAAIGSLKGFRHGGANHKVRQMMTDIMQNVQHWDSDDEVENYLERILRREVGDKSGLIYGIGHAIYTLSDPRAVELKKQARSLAAKTGYADQFALYERIERLAPDAFHKVTGNEKVVCANVDFYSGLVYEMLGIPEDLYTPMFAVSRISGWCAHRIEELTTGGRIIRPAYRALPTGQTYVPLKDRHYDTKSVL